MDLNFPHYRYRTALRRERNPFEEKQNKLINAIREGNRTLVSSLMKNMKPDDLKWATSDTDISPMGACILSGNMDMLDMLLWYRISVNMPPAIPGSGKVPRDSPVGLAIKMKQSAMLFKLLRAGAFCKDPDYVTQAMFLSDRELDCFKVLMKHLVCDVNENGYLFSELNYRWYSPYMLALDCRQSGHLPLDILRQAIDYRSVLSVRRKDSNLVSDIVDNIIKFGFPLDKCVTGGSSGYCPLELAIMNKHINTAVVLVKAGCAVRKANRGDMLMNSIHYRAFKLIHILVCAGSEITEKHIVAIQKIYDGFHHHEELKKPSEELVKWMKSEKCTPASLQRKCRVVIRDYLREITDHKTILPIIEQLPILPHIKQYLALDIQ